MDIMARNSRGRGKDKPPNRARAAKDADAAEAEEAAEAPPNRSPRRREIVARKA
jgi:hypothetical protein